MAPCWPAASIGRPRNSKRRSSVLLIPRRTSIERRGQPTMRSLRSDDRSSLDQANQKRHHREDEQDVDVPAQRIRRHHSEKPEDEQDDEYSPQHAKVSFELGWQPRR